MLHDQSLNRGENVLFVYFKETVSQELRWVSFESPFQGLLPPIKFYFILLKGHFTIYICKSNVLTTLQFQIIWMILDAAVFCVCLIPDYAKTHQISSILKFQLNNKYYRITVLTLYHNSRSCGSSTV